MSTHDDYKSLYQHKDSKEMQVFIQIKLRTAAQKAKKDYPNIMLAYNGNVVGDYPGGDAATRTAEKTQANEDLFTVLCSIVGNEDLQLVLATSYVNKGYEAMTYIKGCFSQGDSTDLLTEANEKYLKGQTKILYSSASSPCSVARCSAGVCRVLGGVRTVRSRSGSRRVRAGYQWLAALCPPL